MPEKLDVLKLQEELWKIAEKEAKKKPSIQKRELKKKLRAHVLDNEVLERILPERILNVIEKCVDVSAEMAITFAKILIETREPRIKARTKKARATAKKAKKAGKAKRGARKGGRKRKTIAAVAEEILRENNGGPMKVTDIKKVIKDEKRVKSKAKDLYSVLMITMDKNPKFVKSGRGEYKLVK